MYHLLHGLRVIDATTVVAGPYATQILGDFGAEIIKIEPVTGDLWRNVRPCRNAGMGAGYLNCNRNKTSVGINLKTGEGQRIVRELVRGADVFTHNMRPLSAEKLGIHYGALREENPQLIYAFAAGFGLDGPNRDWPAYDDIIQSMAGIAALNGNAEGEPRFLTTVICDKVVALHLAIAVLAAVNHRQQTGEGAFIETPMFETMASFMMIEHMGGATFEPDAGPMGYPRLTSAYRKPYATKDGYITVLPYNTTNWQRFLELIGRDDLVHEPWVTDHAERSDNIDRLYEIIEAAMPARTTAEWLDVLKARDIPCAPVQSMEDLFEDPHLTAVNFFQSYTHPQEGPLRTARTPFGVTGVSKGPDHPPQPLGAGTREVLQGLGYSDDRINDLAHRNIIALNE